MHVVHSLWIVLHSIHAAEPDPAAQVHNSPDQLNPASHKDPDSPVRPDIFETGYEDKKEQAQQGQPLTPPAAAAVQGHAAIMEVRSMGELPCHRPSCALGISA